MSFDTEWLDLREPADHAARDAELMHAFAELMPTAPRIVDLGSGTGSTVRALSRVLPNARWTLTDNDPELLAEAKSRASEIETVQVDLARDLARPMSHPSDAITASALIDLVSAEWLDELVALAGGRVIYIALSYDGEEHWSPPHPDDAAIFRAFQKHQRGDKGFGPALGAEAVPYLKIALERAGYRVRVECSPWKLTPGPLMSSLLSGISRASEEAGIRLDTLEKWENYRVKSDQCRIGHLDLLAHR